MRITSILTGILITSMVFSTATTMAEEKVYRWTDENGVVHFSNQPPDDVAAEIVKLPKAAESSSPPNSEPGSAQDGQAQPSYAQVLRDERAQERREAQEKKKEMDALCDQHLRVITKLEPVTRALVEQPDGSVVRMDDNERVGRIRESKDFMAENCDQYIRSLN